MALKILHFDEINSTNVWLYDKMAGQNDIADTVVVADHQTAGRGMDKNRWESEKGKNLLFSIALNVNYLEAENQFKISQAVSVAIVETLSQYIDNQKLFIKWPNDIYFGDKKLAGMLIQNTIEGRMMGVSIIGIGLNVNQLQFSKDIPNPISLKIITGKEYDLKKLLNLLIVNIKDAVENLRYEEKCEETNRKYISKSYRYQKWADYFYLNEVKLLIITGFDKYGRLLLHDKEGAEIVCDVKELQFFPPSCPLGSEADV
ncbi:MAG: biotin--[acetyl-CoA-carboxylase] ligase [Bacteroidales bacterium]|nr:biotin--[acetyl-CoA-carboxylase] ligase [Bacteroidales bacterium]